MLEYDSDEPDFTDEQLRAALKRVGEAAREAAFAAGRPVFILKGTSIVALHADGAEDIIESFRSELKSDQDHK